MAENQNPISFRADEETKAKFSEICEQFASKGAALQALIASYEADSAKAALPGCAALIDDFRAHLDAISRSYIGQLDLTANTEERVRQDYAAQIDSLNKALQASQQQAQAAQETAEKAQAALDLVKEQAAQEQQQAAAQVAEYVDKADRAEQARQIAEKSAEDARRTADTVSARVKELTEERDLLRAAAKKADGLIEELTKTKNEITRLETAAEVATAKAETAQAKAVADAEKAMQVKLDALQKEMQGKLDKLQEKLDVAKDELSKTKDKLHEVLNERDELARQLKK
jgi:chromosome segregation ATPase